MENKNKTAIVKAGVISELVGPNVRYYTWAQTWDGTLYFEVGTQMSRYDEYLQRAKDALCGEKVDNGAWCRGSLGG